MTNRRTQESAMLPVGLSAARSGSQEYRLGLLRGLAERRHLAESRGQAPRADPHGSRPGSNPQCRLPRHPDGHEHRDGRVGRLRRRQEDQGTEASYPGGHEINGLLHPREVAGENQ
jgi:hypothetical protein